ncbi:related to Exoribonuclease II [Sporisorium reilianum SRZ2]|uniref:Related to Exoribonuclease II n=1 Tax=Sporisorium reilianum (strain SRZ2) TaxID=999809 RepID=E6ZN27_SPORE|nr:related to Exoribonuclease II [Sporisorium reilianum SRZ2]
MKLPASSSRLLLDGTHITSGSTQRSIRTYAPHPAAWKKPRETAKQSNERTKQNRVANTILTASRLGRHADSISKSDSDRYSGWRQTPGPSTRRNVGRPKLSRETDRSLARSVASSDAETLLGSHAAGVLMEPLLRGEDAYDGFGSASANGISARDFIAPRRDLRPGDFVEVRRGEVAVGIVLPPPDDVQLDRKEATIAHRTHAGMRDLFVLVTSGQIVLFKDNDVMMQIPGVIEASLTRAAAATSTQYVVSSNSRDSPVNSDGSLDAHSFAHAADADPVEGTAPQEEPVDVPRFEARASICNKLRVLERQKEKELQRLLPSFQSLFLLDADAASLGYSAEAAAKLRKQRMDLRTGAITTFEAARLMHELQVRRASSRNPERRAAALTASTVYAAHALLMSHPTHFLADALSHRTSQLFTCRSDAERANLRLISGWITSPPGSEGQQYIDAFCAKASKIRAWAEAHPHDASGAPRFVDPPHADLDITWTPQDRSIIEFVQASLGSRREVQEDTHGSISMEIVKRAGGHFQLLPHPNVTELLEVERAAQLMLVDPERALARSMLEMVGTDMIGGPDLQHALVMRFLVSIGALPPWQNPIQLDASFRSATLGENGGEPEPEPNAAEEVLATTTTTESMAKKFGVSLDQRVEAIRHDFGKDHTVYVIDDEGAFELDDGISIEPVQGREAEQAWVHVHIADPTAWIQPDDALGQRAERRYQSLYFPEARWAMLPDEFVRGGVGLRPASALRGHDSDGQRVMTFSALVDLSTGLVQDTRVRPALVHDVQTRSYNQVSAMLADSTSPQSATSSELALLLEVATRLSENRARCSAFVTHRPNHVVRISPLPLPLPHVPVSAAALQRPYFFAGSPSISVATEGTQASASGPALAQFVVSELMILAGRIAASYGKQHNLAFAYRYQPRPESDREADEVLDMRANVPGPETGAGVPPVSEQGVVGHGQIAYHDILARGLSLSASGYAVAPGHHFSLGIVADHAAHFAPAPHLRDAITAGGYARATSPLRRYADMLTHWQIKHHLVHGAPRLRAHDVERVLPQLERQEVATRQLMRSAERFWMHMVLQRGFAEGDAATRPLTARVGLPEVRVNGYTLGARVRVNVEEVGLPADLEWGATEAPPRAGAVFSVVPVAVAMAGIRSGLTVRRV